MSGLAHTLITFFAPHVALADTTGFAVSTGIPGPLNIGTYGLLGFIQNGYIFALVAAGVLAVASIVYGALQYTASRGNPSKLSDAWDRIVQALIGLLLLVGAGTLLAIINPGLLHLELPGLVAVNQSFSADTYTLTASEIKELDQTEPNWRRPKGTGGCKTDSANRTLCGVDNMSRCPAWNAKEASAICNVESHGDPAIPSGTDRCTLANGRPSPGFSMGLLQINLIAHYNKIPQACRGLFVGPSGSPNDHSLGSCVAHAANGVCIQWSCKFVGDNAGFQACRDAFRANNGALAIGMACQIYAGQSTANKWKPWPWTSRVACHYGDYRSHPELYP